MDALMEPGVVQVSHTAHTMMLDDGFREHLRERLRYMVGQELVKAMAANPGGLIVGTLHEDEHKTHDFGDFETTTFTTWAHVAAFPDPTEYLLRGGPYDGQKFFGSGNAHIFLPRPWAVSVPLATIEGSVVAEASFEKIEYVRMGGTNVYRYER